MYIQDWIGSKYKEIAEKLPSIVHPEPASFLCGFNLGYKQALLDLESILEDGARIYKSICPCGDKYHGKGEICL